MWYLLFCPDLIVKNKFFRFLTKVKFVSFTSSEIAVKIH